jgi:hypothetical protein
LDNNGEVYLSEKFKLFDHCWQLSLYGGGVNSEYRNFVSVHLQKCSPGRFDTKLSLSVAAADREYSRFRSVTFKGIENVEWDDFLDRATSEKYSARYRQLTIKLVISPSFKDPVPATVASELQQNDTALHRGMKNLMVNEGIPRDVQFRFTNSNTVIGAHRIVLMAMSPVFQAMFQAEMIESESGEIHLDDVDPNIMQELLLHIYTGAFSNESVLMDLPREMFIVASKYQIMDAVLECETRLAGSISLNNLHELKELADACHSVALKKACVQFAIRHCQEIFLDVPFPKYHSPANDK